MSMVKEKKKLKKREAMAAARAWWRRFIVDKREGRERGRHSQESPEWRDQTELGDVRSWPTE